MRYNRRKGTGRELMQYTFTSVEILFNHIKHRITVYTINTEIYTNKSKTHSKNSEKLSAVECGEMDIQEECFANKRVIH